MSIDPVPYGGLDGSSRAVWGDGARCGSLLLVLAVMIVVNAASNLLDWSMLWLGPLGALLLLTHARRCGLTWQQLGLSSAQLPRGLRWAGGAILLVAVGYLIGVMVPITRSGFLDPRYHLSPGEAVLTALVLIPVGTVLFEEIAFRSVLWGMLSRHALPGRVAVITSALFGLWHVLPAALSVGRNPAVSGAADELGAFASIGVIGGTVLVTGLGGLVFAWLRHRSDSILASAGMHWATNGLGVLVGLLAWRLGS